MLCGIDRASTFMSKKSPTPGAIRDGDDWAIEIADLAALVSVLEREGPLFVSLRSDGSLSLTIYDDYVE